MPSPGAPPSPQPQGYLQEAAHLGSQGRELLGGRLGVELPAEQLGRQRRVAVVGGLRDAAEQGPQRLAALRARSQCLGLVGLVLLGLLGHVGGAAPAPRPAPLPALGWRLAAGARGGRAARGGKAEALSHLPGRVKASRVCQEELVVPSGGAQGVVVGAGTLPAAARSRARGGGEAESAGRCSSSRVAEGSCAPAIP